MVTPSDGPASWDLVLRMLEQIDARIGRLVSQETHTAAQEATAQRLRDQAEDLSEWKAESRGAHVELGARINEQNIAFRALFDNYREKQEALERASREQAQQAAEAERLRVLAKLEADKKDRASRIFNISMSVLAIVGSLVVGIVLNAMGAP